MAAVNSGAAAFSMPASAEPIRCSAKGNSTNGKAIQVRPSSAIAGQADRGTGRRAAGRTARVPAPKASRSMATSGGRSAWTPILISKNEAPQVTATPASSAQSPAANPP